MVAGVPTLSVSFGTAGSFTQVSADLILTVSIRRGREQQNLFLDSGTAYVVLNNQSGAFDPSNTSSPWYGVLTAGMQVQISGNGIVLYTGYLEDNAVDQGIYPTVSLTFVDGIATFGKTMVPALATSQYQENAAARAARILDLLGWSASARSLTGTVEMLPTTLGLAGMDLLEQCANVIGGRFYVSRTGVATLVPLADKFSRPTQLLFSDQGDANSVLYDGIITNPGTDYVYNEAVVFRGPGETQISSKYGPSVSTYGLKSKKIDAPTNTTVAATNLAYYVARKDADAAVLVEQIDFSAINIGALATDFLSTELFDMVTVKRQTYDGRFLTYNCVVEGIAMTIDANNWRVSYFTSLVDPYTISI